MRDNSRVKKTKTKSIGKGSRRRKSTTSLRMLRILSILLILFLLPTIALFLGVESPDVWKFMSGIGNSLAIIYLARSLR